MDLNKIMEEYDADMHLTQENLHEKAYYVPQLHAKWLRRYFQQKVVLNKMKKELLVLYRKRYYYYREEYEYRLDNQKLIEFHIMSDDEYSVENRKVKNQESLVEFLDKAVQRISFLGNDVKNIIAYASYLNGV